MSYVIKCKDKYVYYFDEDYQHGEINLVSTNVNYDGLFYITKESAEFRLNYIRDNFSWIVNNGDIDVFDVMEMEVVKVY